jgi:hypothetical protein
MLGLYGFAARLSGCMAGLCAVLALLAMPSSARADLYSDCQAQCAGLSGQELDTCMANCLNAAPYDCTNNCTSPFCPGTQANPCKLYGCGGDNGKCGDNKCVCYGTKSGQMYDCKGCD